MKAIKNVLLFFSKLFAIIMSIAFGALTVGTDIAMANADNISNFLGQNITNTVKNENYDETEGGEEEENIYFESAFGSVAEVKASGIEYTERVMAEGAVLLHNDGALPLNKSEDKVSMFSASSADPVWSGSRESSEKKGSSAKVDLLAGLKNAGLSVNENLYNWYKSSGYGRKRVGTNSGIYEVWNVNEAPWSALPESKTASGYNVAMFVVSRIAGEGTDPTIRNLGENKVGDETNGNYLLLTPNEKDVLANLKAQKDNGTFDKIIVLMNTTNQVAVDFVDAYDVDAVLYSGSIGSAGANAIGKILTGEVNPSGKLSDTFWKNHYLNPTLTNFGQMHYYESATMLNQYVGFTYGDTGTYSDGYVVYQEGIYSGYRYTETRYEDTVMKTDKVGDFNYYDAVAYPFGYGLSYTDFDYSDMQVSYDAETDEYTVKVTVTNVGAVKGKNAPQLFLQKPYTAYDKTNNVEKAAVELVDFAKTAELEVGASEEITMKVARRDLASYDSYGEGTYILEQGNYYLTVAHDAHDAVNNILTKKGYTAEDGVDATADAELAYEFSDVQEDEFLKYSVAETGKEIVNHFDNVDPKLYKGITSDFEYMTRKNWAGTVSFAYDENANFLGNYVKMQRTSTYNEDEKLPTIEKDDGTYPKYGSTTTHWQLVDLMFDENGERLPYEHERWEELLDQLTYTEMADLLSNGFAQTKAIVSISKPATYDYDSDLGVIGGYNSSRSGLASKTDDPDKNQKPALYSDNGIVAATRNKELIYEYGVQWGEDCLWAGYHCLYGTGGNIHRNPYNGRTYGYFSEDPVLAGVMAGQINLGMESKGSYMTMKHCVLNEQECNRCGGSCWANEQTIREVYLKSFQVAIEDGSVQGVMTSLTRLGAIPAPHHPFVNEILRGEFGMTGYSVTDSYMGYMEVGSCVLAGNDLPLSQDSRIYNYAQGYSKVAWAMRDTVHNILYTTVHSSAMNGVSSDIRFVPTQPAWQFYLEYYTPIVTTLTWVAIGFFVVMELWDIIDRRRQNA